MEIPHLRFEVIKFCLSKFLSVLREDKRLLYSFLVAGSVFFVSIFCNVVLPLILKSIVQKLESTSANIPVLTAIIIGYGVLWTVAQIGEHVREMTSVRIVERTIRKLTNLFYFSILNHRSLQKVLPSTGAIINKLAVFREGFHNLVWGLLFFLLPTITEIICACGVLWYFYGWFYTSILLLAVGLFGICSYIGVSLYLKLQAVTNEISYQLSGFLSDRLYNIETVCALGNPSDEVSVLDSKLYDLENRTTKTKRVFETLRIIQGVIIGGALTLVVYHCVNNITLGNLHISDFVLINGYVLQFFIPLSSLGVILNEIFRSFADVSGMVGLMKSIPITEQMPGNVTFARAPSRIIAKNVSFSYTYGSNSFALKNINFELKAGWKVGIVGYSGSGKTTLGKLLSGLYEPDHGEISLDNTSLTSCDRPSLKSVICYAPQHVQIFNDTLEANILYGSQKASFRDLEHAIEASQLKELIPSLPDGLKTVLGEQGYSLSGGERQRIGLARVILRKPSIYILDEPTSFLDLKTEELILKYFQSQEKISTQIIIAHRLHMLMDADWIIMLKHGEIIAQGKPRSLLDNSSPFIELWELDNNGGIHEVPIATKETSIKKAS